jgi:hypothetical protein
LGRGVIGVLQPDLGRTGITGGMGLARANGGSAPPHASIAPGAGSELAQFSPAVAVEISGLQSNPSFQRRQALAPEARLCSRHSR